MMTTPGKKAPSMEERMAAAGVGPYDSPMGHGFTATSKEDYGNDGMVVHHFLTHGPDGKALSAISHSTMTDRSKGRKHLPTVG